MCGHAQANGNGASANGNGAHSNGNGASASHSSEEETGTRRLLKLLKVRLHTLWYIHPPSGPHALSLPDGSLPAG